MAWAAASPDGRDIVITSDKEAPFSHVKRRRNEEGDRTVILLVRPKILVLRLHIFVAQMHAGQ